MSRLVPDNQAYDETIPVTALHNALLMMLAAIGGAFAAIIVLPLWLPGLTASLLGTEPKAYWYLSRASALVAYSLLWLSVALGLLVSNRLARVWPGGPVAADVHQFTSLLGLGLALFHVVILLGDRYMNYSVIQLLVPFSGENYRPVWVGLGQFGLYLMCVVAFSFYIRRWVGYRTWRTIHYLSFVLFALVLVHGAMSGTDAASEAVRLFYWSTGVSILFLTIFRVLVKSIRRTA